MKSIHDKIAKVRKPRVHISYELEDGGASVKKELPFVVGVMGNYSGHGTDKLKPIKDRKFIQIDPDNFNEVMQKMEPNLSFKVDNKLADDDSQMTVDLKFNKVDDFEPDRIAQQVEPLKKLLDVRVRLKDLLSKADRSEDLEALLESILQDESKLKELADQVKSTEEPETTEEKE